MYVKVKLRSWAAPEGCGIRARKPMAHKTSASILLISVLFTGTNLDQEGISSGYLGPQKSL